MRIHYEVEGQGPSLVLKHGLARSIRGWRLYGYVEELSTEYRLILVDANGHGDSEKPDDPQAYSAELMTGDIVAVLDNLGVEKANYWSYSMARAEVMARSDLILPHAKRFLTSGR